MISLDQAYREAAALVKKMARSTSKTRKKYWKGKKIIPNKKWYKKIDFPEDTECLKYIPDSFEDSYYFLWSPANESQYKNREKWKKDFFEFLNYKKDPEFGKYKCKTCPLNEFELAFGIKPILQKYLEKNLPNYSSSCDIVNIFKCPYGHKENTRILLDLGDIFRIVDEALQYCWYLTWKHDFAHYVDFQTGRVGRERQSISWNIWEKMVGLKVPRLPLRDVQDVYNVLTNPELMELLLDEYVDALGMRNYGNVVTHEFPTFVVEEVEEYKKNITHFFSENMDLVELESLTDCFGYTMKQEELNRIKNSERFQEIGDRDKSGTCLFCSSFAKVYCMNCSIWVCADHWEQHGLEKHGFEVEIPDYHINP